MLTQTFYSLISFYAFPGSDNFNLRIETSKIQIKERSHSLHLWSSSGGEDHESTESPVNLKPCPKVYLGWGKGQDSHSLKWVGRWERGLILMDGEEGESLV